MTKTSVEWGVKGYSKIEELLEDPKVEALSISTPRSVHERQVMKALEAGKHVLCEKPLSLKSEGIAQMRKLATKHSLVLMPAENFLYRPPFPEVKKIIENGELGKIIYSAFHVSHFASQDLGKGWRAKLEYSGVMRYWIVVFT